MALPLDGVLIVDFSQFLAGPYASLRLQDLGARVIKVENPAGGDLCRRLYLSNTVIDGDSTLFHAINRGKESIALDLGCAKGRADALALASQAQIVIQNFRPGVIQRLGLGYEAVKRVNPSVVYGSISGYGETGPWANLPGQDLLAQARSGIMWLSGNQSDGPVPVGLPLADLLAGATLAQGILAGLYRQATQGQGTLVETSLLEAIVDAQFELLTTYLNNGQTPPQRATEGSAHGYLSAPYGVYDCKEGQLALAMTPLPKLAEGLGLPAIGGFEGGADAGFLHREEIRSRIAAHLKNDSAKSWERRLNTKGIWCARVLQWPELLGSETFKALDMLSEQAGGSEGGTLLMRTPLRVDGQRAKPQAIGPKLDAHGAAIRAEFLPS